MSSLETLDECMSNGSLTTGCITQYNEVKKCTQKFFCPKLYLDWMFCMEKDKRKCKKFQTKLDDCLDQFSNQVDRVANEYISLNN